jgi:hypothetical protein
MLKPKLLGLLGLLVVAGVVALILFIFFPSLPDPKCAALLARPENVATIPLPANCVQTTEMPPDNMMKYLENERNKRGLIFQEMGYLQDAKPDRNPRFRLRPRPTLVAQLYPWHLSVPTHGDHPSLRTACS